ncbi:MAG: hypothetical protein JF590_09105, partial [Gemmatimonadetes bacterium]|nr:hypothetical protein [Gemmatimonadota bacterium]
DELNHHRRRYTRATMRDLAREARLEVEWSRYLFLLVGIAKLGVRAKERLFPAPPAVPTLPSPALNTLAGWVARADLAVGTALPLPFGSSLVVVLAPRDAGPA